MFKSLWAENQKFLLLVGGGLVIFLASALYLVSLAEGADATYEKCDRLEKDIVRLHRDLTQTYRTELERAVAFERFESDVFGKLGLPEEPLPKSDKTLGIRFLSEIAKVWENVERKAKKRGLVLPEKLTGSDFDIDEDSQPEDFQVFRSYLRIVGTALEALVDSGMIEIGGPELMNPEIKNILVDEQDVGDCLYRGVAFEVSGPYESYLRLLKVAQHPGSYLQVRITNLKPEKKQRAANQGLLSADLEFVGILVGPNGPEDGAQSGSRRLKRTVKRK